MPDQETKKKYRVKAGHRWGPFFQYGPGDILELTEYEASGFLDSLELAPKGAKVDERQFNNLTVLTSMTIEELRALPEWPSIPDPKPRRKTNIIEAILKARESTPPIESQGDDE